MHDRTTHPHIRRRSVLAVLLGVVLVAAVTACGARMDVATTRTSLVAVDRTRSTPPRGASGRVSSRTLRISVWLPISGGPWPLIVFAHGFDTTPEDYAPLLEAWARAGYVVAAPAFPIATSAGDGPARRDDNWEEPADLSTTIGAVLANPTLGQRVDASRIGAAGHSDGGSAVAALALNDAVHDSRISAYLVASGALQTSGAYAAARGGNWGPINNGALMVVSGDADPNNPWARAVAGRAAEPEGILTILGGGHFAPYVDGGVTGVTVRAATADFFNRWLRGDGWAGAWLARDGNTDGVARLETSTL